jgi:hypothetical protein
MPTAERKLCGQASAGPSGVPAQLQARISAAISPFAAKIDEAGSHSKGIHPQCSFLLPPKRKICPMNSRHKRSWPFDRLYFHNDESMQCTENAVSMRELSDVDTMKQITCRNNCVTKRELYSRKAAGIRPPLFHFRARRCAGTKLYGKHM